MEMEALFYTSLAAAFVRGKLGLAPDAASPSDDELIQLGLRAGLRLYKFKRTMELRRVRRVLGALRGLAPTSLLDIGSGRGTFLWPLVDAFPTLPITALDRDARRIADITAVRAGGVDSVTAVRGDAARLAFADATFDGVTMLEVLEHIPDAPRALAEALRVASRFVILSVPSKPDNNPEHIHLFTGDMLTQMLHAAGARRVSLDYVLNHIISIAMVHDR